MLVGTVHMAGTIQVATVHDGYCSQWVLFLDFWFVARVRARADNVFKGNVNNKRNCREYSEYDQLY